MNQPISDTIKCVGVRFFANPELEDRTVPETEEMCRKTIGVLEGLNAKRPIIVMMADQQNKDPHCVQLRAMGKAVANVDRDAAPMIRGMLKASSSGKLITQITDVNVNRHGFFYVKMPVAPKEFTAEEIGVDWSKWTIESPLVLPAESFLEEEELNLVIRDVLLPDLANIDVALLTEYFDLWMRTIRFNQSREVAFASGFSRSTIARRYAPLPRNSTICARRKETQKPSANWSQRGGNPCLAHPLLAITSPSSADVP